MTEDRKFELATLAGGCFWCTEAVFKRLKGVDEVVSGYAGGTTENPTYDEVSMGKTGYAEAIQVKFDPSVISFERLLDVFWELHDPTTLNRQGNDVGTQYRSVIFYHDDNQKELAESSKKRLIESGHYHDEIVTEIRPAERFYPAEKYHQDFYDQNQDYPYCRVIIDPKIQKLYKNFKDVVK